MAVHQPELGRILITGSRNWENYGLVQYVLTDLYAKNPSAVLVSGNCPSGADAMCERMWCSLGGKVERHPADWSLGRKAGPLRNQQMVDLGADLCVAFRRGDSRGTTHCANAATLAGIPTEWYCEDD